MKRILLLSLLVCIALVCCTYYAMSAPPDALVGTSLSRYQVLDRRGTPLSVTYQNELNITDIVKLENIPPLLKTAFVVAEDKNFYTHKGVDWLARASALKQNISKLKIVRGASTISEQVVKILHPRKRNLWARWIETFEAYQLDKKFPKDEILEFYLNQVPYAGQRRGIVQAARYYWDRDLDTLNEKELLTLAVLVRAPSKLDLYKDTKTTEGLVNNLAQRLYNQNFISEEQLQTIKTEEFQLKPAKHEVQANHFVRYVLALKHDNENINNSKITTTLDAELQNKVQNILDNRLKDLSSRQARNAAAIVVDNRNNDVLAWVNGGSYDTQAASRQIDAVITPRQPGSTLKPFLYALALSKGWTAATVILDAPLAQAVGVGLHNYRNYSRTFYGNVRLREALANSLNIPTIRAIQYTGVQPFLTLLHDLGITTLNKGALFYGEGLALGNGEITLYELVQAYTMFANNGLFKPHNTILKSKERMDHKVIFSDQITSIIGNILSDPIARRIEFNSSLMDFPMQTAVKTGTSTDYRDAWAIGYSGYYTVGVWIGNLDRSSMKEISGAGGPVLALRSIFGELHKHKDAKALFMSNKLVLKRICTKTGLQANADCPTTNEYFTGDNIPATVCNYNHDTPAETSSEITLLMPTNNLRIAIDPRIPPNMQAFAFEVSKNPNIERVEWILNNKTLITTAETKYLWTLQRGEFTLRAKIFLKNQDNPIITAEKTFWVK